MTTAGGVRCWGDNQYGALGDGTSMNRDAPTAEVLAGARDVVGGSGFTCALMTAGGVRCWGVGVYGELGDGTQDGRLTPGTKDILTGIQAIASAHRSGFACALSMAGGVRCWGDNVGGQLGIGTTVGPSLSPAPYVAGLDGNCP